MKSKGDRTSMMAKAPNCSPGRLQRKAGTTLPDDKDSNVISRRAKTPSIVGRNLFAIVVLATMLIPFLDFLMDRAPSLPTEGTRHIRSLDDSLSAVTSDAGAPTKTVASLADQIERFEEILDNREVFENLSIRLSNTDARITVFASTSRSSSPLAEKEQQRGMVKLINQDWSGDDSFTSVILSVDQQKSYMQKFPENSVCGNGDALEKFEYFLSREQEHIATEIWKYCAMTWAFEGSTQDNVVAYIDLQSNRITLPMKSLLQKSSSLDLNKSARGLAVLGDSATFSHTVHGSLLVLQKSQKHVAQEMLRVLLDTPPDALLRNAKLLPETLYHLIEADAGVKQQSKENEVSLKQGLNLNKWYLFEYNCYVAPMSSYIKRRSKSSLNGQLNGYHLAQGCPKGTERCCTIYDDALDEHIIRNNFPLFPYHKATDDVLPLPLNPRPGTYKPDELPFIATIREETFTRPSNFPETPNAYDLLKDDELLSRENYEACKICFFNQTEIRKHFDFETCTPCYDECHGFCDLVAGKSPLKLQEKFVSKKMYVTLPLYRHDDDRYIPRIIHQTWRENVTRAKYPTISRFAESFSTSGWEYKFYTDDDMREFLVTHFPSEVVEAYDALLPGAFKADLFRYCALLIHGGLYADIDKLLESNLDISIPNDIGFTTVMPSTGKGQSFCLHNGFMASAPGHPFLLETIEAVVNRVRNRFTAVDLMFDNGPHPNLMTLQSSEVFYITGPCILGTSVNKVLGRGHEQAYYPGNLRWHSKSSFSQSSMDALLEQHYGQSKVHEGQSDRREDFFGRTVILDKTMNRGDGKRFILKESNIVVAASHIPDTLHNTRDENHYSKTHDNESYEQIEQNFIYGVGDPYKDDVKANANIKLELSTRATEAKLAEGR